MNPILRNTVVAAAMVAVVAGGFGAWIYHGNPSDVPIEQFEGKHPRLEDPEPERIPSVALPRTVGWDGGAGPKAANGLAVTRFAEGLDHPRTMLTLPNGDVLVAETSGPAMRGGGVTGFFARMFMRRVGALVDSPDTIVLLRDLSGAGKATQRFVLAHAGLHSPSGMAYANGTLYVANNDAILAFAFQPGQTALAGNPRKIMDLPIGGEHWMRNLQLSADGTALFVAIGSSSNIGENGLDAEKGRAAIYQVDLATGHARQYAAGLRNPNGMDINPSTGELWTTVNERDQLGPNLVPDYLTNVPVGAHYGWPWLYWKDVIDNRVDLPMPEYLTDYSRKPEFALGPHVAALGLTFAHGGERMGPLFANGAFIARHGSWNRRPPVGYDVVFVRFDVNGNPTGLPIPILTGFLTGNGDTHGRPTWLTWGKDGALLVSDDTAGIIWRVIMPGAAPSVVIKPVETAHLAPQKELNSEATLRYGAKFQSDQKVKQ